MRIPRRGTRDYEKPIPSGCVDNLPIIVWIQNKINEKGGVSFVTKEDKARSDKKKKKEKKGNSFFPEILIPSCIAFLKKIRK